MNEGYIYKITNLINGKMYIGQTTKTIEERFNHHKSDSMRPDRKGSTFPLYVAMRKYGIENFKIECIEKCHISQLDEKEIFWINSFDTYNNGYNATLGGCGGQLLNLNEKKIVNEYYNMGTLTKVANLNHCSTSTIRTILRKYRIKIKSSSEHQKEKGKTIYQYTEDKKELINVFDNRNKLGEWLIKNKLSKAKTTRKASESVYENLRLGKNVVFGYYWELLEDYSEEYKSKKRKKLFEKRKRDYIKQKEKQIGYNICPCCNKNKKLITSTYCIDCNKKHKNELATEHLQEKITRAELKSLIRTTSFTEIGKKFNVSDNAIRKWCKRYNLPTKTKEIKKYSIEEWEHI